MFDGILFDLDGTLWDSLEGISTAWNMALAIEVPSLAGRVTPERLKPCMGMLLPDIVHALFPDAPQDGIAQALERCCYIENQYLAEHGGILYPGVAETLPRLAEQWPLFIVSNCQAGYIEAFFAAHGLQNFFQDWACPGSTGQPKAVNIRLVAERNGLTRPLYVGDTQGDRNAAAAAGVPFLHAAYGFGSMDASVPAVAAFSQLPDAILAMGPP